MMDWTQANWLELSAFGVGLAILSLSAMAVVGGAIYTAACWAKGKLARIRRMGKTTRALKCEVCAFNDGNGDLGLGTCGKLGLDTAHAPVLVPGCSWGIERR